MARILVCRGCKTAMRIRDYEGPVSEDWELQEMIDRHLGKAADPRPESHPAQLMLVDDEDLEKMDNATLQRAIADDLDVQISEFRNDFKDQAMQCYQLHQRPKGSCRDWKDETRVIGRKTGVPPEKRAYLCDYCPVAVHMQNKLNEVSGVLKGHKWR